MAAKKFSRRSPRCFLVMFERSGHRTTSPRVWCEKLVRTASVEDASWSQPSLRSRLGMGVSQAWPLLSRPLPAPLITARPFGLGLRFDEALLVALRSLAARSIKPTPRNGTVASTFDRAMQHLFSPGSKPVGGNSPKIEVPSVGREPDKRLITAT